MSFLFHRVILALTITIGVVQAEKPNVLLICVDDLRPELPSFGKKYIHAPAIEKLISQGRLYKRHYVQAPTCGASRFSLLSGLYPETAKLRSNDAILHFTGEKDHAPTLPQWMRKNGYLTLSLGKVSHYPGGLYGTHWADPQKEEIPNAWDHRILSTGAWKHPQGFMHGVANGVARKRGITPAIEAKANATYPDDLILKDFEDSIQKLTSSKKPWFCAVGIMKPHLPFATHKKFLDLYSEKTLPAITASNKPKKGNPWHGSGELMNGYSTQQKDPRKDSTYATALRKHYAACVSSVDASIAKIIHMLEKAKLAQKTIIIIWSDHGFHLGEHAIWGKHTLYHIALHSPLIIKVPKQNLAGRPSEAIVETIDIYPTICDLCSLPRPAHLQGSSLITTIQDPSAKLDGKAFSYWKNERSLITKDEHIITNMKNQQITQRYSLTNDPHETNNLAQ